MNKFAGLGLLGLTMLLGACAGPANTDPTPLKYGALPTTDTRPGDPPHVRLQDDQNSRPFDQRFCPPDVQARGNC